MLVRTISGLTTFIVAAVFAVVIAVAGFILATN